MAFDPNLALNQLVALYRQAYIDILERISRAEARGTATRFQRRILADVSGILQSLEETSEEWAKQVLPKVYEGSRAEELAAFRRAGLQVPVGAGFARVHLHAVEVLATNLTENLRDATGMVGRRIRDDFRRAQLEAVSQKLTTGGTIRETKKGLQRTLAERGLGAFRDAAGRVWALDGYASM